jgi:hypothetical protein
MKSRKQLPLTSAMAAALMALPACSSGDDWNGDVVAKEDTAVCVDKEGKRVDDDRCAPRTAHSGGSGVGSAFLWYYLGRNARLPYYGDSIHDRRFAGAGSFTPASRATYHSAPAETRMTRSAAVSRGGLGSSGRRYGGGWS